MSTNKDEPQSFLGKKIEQVRASAPEFEHRIGRKGTVIDAFMDEKGNYHVQTDDGVWCPVALIAVID